MPADEHGGTRTPHPALSQRFVRGSLWILVGRVASRGIDFLKAVVVARLLSPEHFGVFALTLLVTSALDALTQSGARSALLQRGRDAEDYYDTAWCVNAFRGLALAFGTFAAAPIAAAAFRVPELTSTLRVVALSLVLQGCLSIGLVSLEKDLRGDRLFLLEVGSSLTSLIALFALAWRYPSVWALIGANVIGAAARLALSYWLAPWRPALRFAWAQWRELATFGRWVFVYSVALFLWQSADKAMIGRLLGPRDLGVYQMAQRIAELPLAQISAVTLSLAFPAYSRLRETPGRLRSAFVRVFTVALSLLFPAAVFMIAYGQAMVDVLFGPKWRDSGPLLQILALGSLITAIDALMTPVLFAVGKPRLEVFKHLARLSVLLIGLPLGIQIGGLTGATWVVSLAAFVLLAFLPVTLRAVHASLRQLGAPMLAGLCLAAPIGAVVAITPARFSPAGTLVFGATMSVSCCLLLGFVLVRHVAAMQPLAEAALQVTSALRLWGKDEKPGHV